MPLYEYHCRECDSQAELLVNGSNVPECPACGSQKLTKLLSVVAAPNRESGGGDLPERSGGSCGAGCGCHPRG